jgi:hypothetical protein
MDQSVSPNMQPPKPIAPLPGAVPPHIRPKIGRNVLGCAGAALLVAILLICALLYAVAKSGIITIPVFSRLYHGPDVTRRVEVHPVAASAFESEIEKRFIRGLNMTSGVSEIRLTEQELTGVLTSVVTVGLQNEEWKVRSIQIVVGEKDLQMYVRLERGILHPEFTIRFLPVAVSGGLSFEPSSYMIGEYTPPNRFLYPLLGYVFKRDLGNWNLSFGEILLKNVKLEDGVMVLNLKRR